MRFLRHLGRLLKELGVFAWSNKAWWIIPVVLMLLLIAVVVITSETLLPGIYTLF